MAETENTPVENMVEGVRKTIIQERLNNYRRQVYGLTEEQKAGIQTQIDTLTIDQLHLLYLVYQQLNIQFNFFMSETTYKDFLNFSYTTSSKYNTNTYKSLIKLLTTSYTYPSQYPNVIKSINLIKNDYSLKEIINIIYFNK